MEGEGRVEGEGEREGRKGGGGGEGGDLALFNCFFVCCLVYAHAHVGLQQF